MSTDDTNTEQVQEQQEQPKPVKKLNKRGDRTGMHHHPNSLANLREQWQPGQSGNPKGRPKSRIPDLLKVYVGKKRAEATKMLNWAEIDEIELSVLSLGNKELNALIKGDDVPMYMKGLALAALHDAKNGRTKTIDLLRDRQFGAVKKEVDVTTGGQTLNEKELSDQQARELIAKLEKEY